jgi:hypothetical protein
MAKTKSKTTCSHCQTSISNNNLERHIKKCIAHSDIKKPQDGQVGRKVWNKGLSKETDSRVQKQGDSISKTLRGRKAWNKGLSKETDSRIQKQGDSISKTLRQKVETGTFIPCKMGIAARQRLSEKQSLHNSGGKSKWYEVAGQKVQGTYEKRFAEALEQEKIKWCKVKTHNHIFKYVLESKIRSYAPDFYLPEYNLYIEIKGFWWGTDKDKMKAVIEQHKDKKILIIDGLDELVETCKNLRATIAKMVYAAD